MTETEQPKEERIIEMDVQRLRDFRNHPFKIREDTQFKQLTESISRYGILSPLIVRPMPEGVYEIISGHRRKYAAASLAVWILAVCKNIEEGAAIVAFMLIMGFLPFSATILEVVIYLVVHGLWIPCQLLSWINGFCVKHMSTGRNGAYSYNNTKERTDSRTNSSWDSWERHDEYDDFRNNDKAGESRGHSSTEDDLQRARRIFNLGQYLYRGRPKEAQESTHETDSSG